MDISKKELYEKVKVKCIEYGEYKVINVREKEDCGCKGNGNGVLVVFWWL